MIRNTLGATHDAFEEKDFTYFEKLCEVTDWLLDVLVLQNRLTSDSISFWS